MAITLTAAANEQSPNKPLNPQQEAAALAQFIPELEDLERMIASAHRCGAAQLSSDGLQRTMNKIAWDKIDQIQAGLNGLRRRLQTQASELQ